MHGAAEGFRISETTTSELFVRVADSGDLSTPSEPPSKLRVLNCMTRPISEAEVVVTRVFGTEDRMSTVFTLEEYRR